VKRKQFDFIVGLIRLAASAGPLLLWIEDAHWLDASSADLLKEIVAATADVPLLEIGRAHV